MQESLRPLVRHVSGRSARRSTSPGAWLTTVATRLCLNLLGSARARRERYVGSLDPRADPRSHASGRAGAPATRVVDPADQVTLDESVNMAFLVVLESMTPARAGRVHPARRLPLHLRRGRRDRRPDAGGLPPAGFLGPASESAPRRLPVTPTAQRAEIVRSFKRAWQAKDIDALIGLLDPNAAAIADGGGLAADLPAPDRGRRADRAAPGSSSPTGAPSTSKLLERTVNGQPGLVARQDGAVGHGVRVRRRR